MHVMAKSDSKMKIYVASSWRNEEQPGVVKLLREAEYEVYDFKNPTEGDAGFHWSDIDPNWQNWTPEEFRDHLNHPIAQEGFSKDINAMHWADVCVLVMPCGRSAHSEAGWMQGHSKPTLILLSDGEPELMYRMFEKVCISMDEVIEHLGILRNIFPYDLNGMSVDMPMHCDFCKEDRIGRLKTNGDFISGFCTTCNSFIRHLNDKEILNLAKRQSE